MLFEKIADNLVLYLNVLYWCPKPLMLDDNRATVYVYWFTK